MTDIEPTRQDWEALYAAARQFQEIECWKWMHDVNVVGVKDPKSDMIGYGCVMGRLGELFGLAVYLGPEGLDLIRKLQFGAISAQDDEVMYGQRSLVLSYGERSLLQKQDREVIKSLGLKPRGNTGWPLFRSYRPGYVPWFLMQEEVRLLTVVLDRVRDVALRAKENLGIFGSTSDGGCLVQTPEVGPGGIVWTEALCTDVPGEDRIDLLPPVDRARINEILAKNLPRAGIWEVDVFFMPMGVRDAGDRPHYPRTLLWVDQQSGYVVTTHLSGPSGYVEEIREQCCKTIVLHGVIPSGMVTANAATLDLFEPLAAELGIELTFARRLRMLQETKRGMMQFAGLR